MNKLLPKTINNPKGFTLIELMVAIAIVAILATVGVTIFNNTQKSARDATRRMDIDAIAGALEANRAPGSATYKALNDNQFAGNKIPTDPQKTNCPAGSVCKYCVKSSSGACASGDVEVSPTAPADASSTFIVCANLETTAGSFYCKSNQQ